MSIASAVDIERFHLSLNVNNLSQSIHFLTALLGCPPKKQRPDYAKFEPADLPIVLSLEPRSAFGPPLKNTAGEGALNHVGIRLTDSGQLVEVQRRLESAGYSTQRAEGVECCYARQTKFWVYDDDHTMWEVYVLEEDLEHRGGEHDALHSPGLPMVAQTCEPASPRQTWTHRLLEEFPRVIPNAGMLDEVILQGTWNATRHAGQWNHQLDQIREALRPGGKLVLHLLTSHEPLTKLEPLPGPAAVVQVVPQLREVLAALDQAGFQDVQFVKYSGTPCFQQQGVEMRETRLEARTPCEVKGDEENVTVVYKGPAAQIIDDHGNIFVRGEAIPVPPSVWLRLAASSLSASFVSLAPSSKQVLTCGVS